MHELAGKTVPESMYLDIPDLISRYYTDRPDPSVPEQRVVFGTSGHRGSSLKLSYNEDHILAISQAICSYRAAQKVDGPLYMGMDTHALSRPAHSTALEVLAANGVTVFIAASGGFTPTPVVSHAILEHNRGRKKGLADGIVITPSHNPPTDGGFKYDPTNGGAADTTATQWIADEANRLLEGGLKEVRRMTLSQALASGFVKAFDYVKQYVGDLDRIIDFEPIRASGLRIGADALGGAGMGYWIPIAEHYGLDLTLLHGRYEPDFRFMHIDHDGKIRMDPSSSWAMAGLVSLKDQYDIAFGNDPDFDRHGIVTPSHGLMNPNHYLPVAMDYLFRTRKAWSPAAAIGKTVVTSCLVDQVATRLGRRVLETPVGFKWFVPGLFDGSVGFCGEESAGAAFLRRDGQVWTTDKDGLIMGLLACEITAATGKDPAQIHDDFVKEFGEKWYARQDSPCTAEQKAHIASLDPERLPLKEVAGEPVVGAISKAPGNGASIGGVKVSTKHGWFAMRPSGTENTFKIYAESTLSRKHLQQLLDTAAKL